MPVNTFSSKLAPPPSGETVDPQAYQDDILHQTRVRLGKADTEGQGTQKRVSSCLYIEN